MALLFQPGKYDSINTDDTTTNVFYVIMFISEACADCDERKIYSVCLQETLFLR